jgi:hypothetical protein
MMNNKGQFFSPDLIIALLIFIIILAFFSVVSSAIAVQIDLYYTKNSLEEFSHAVTSPLVSFSGEPFDWENESLVDINFFGLVSEKNVLDQRKIERFVSLLDSDYDSVREKLGLGKYDFQLNIVDSNGSTIFSGGQISENYLSKITQSRIASYKDRQVLVTGVISYAS